MSSLKNVKDFMNGNIVTISLKASVTDAAKLMLKHKISSLIVKQDETYYGILTEEDITQKVVAQDLVPTEVPVVKIMTPDIIAIESRTTMRDAFLEMNKRKVRHIAVTEHGHYIGVLSVKDFASYYANWLEEKKNAKGG